MEEEFGFYEADYSSSGSKKYHEYLINSNMHEESESSELVCNTSLYNSIANHIIESNLEGYNKKDLVDAIKLIIQEDKKYFNKRVKQRYTNEHIRNEKSCKNQRNYDSEFSIENALNSSGLYACIWGAATQKEIKRNMRHRSQESRRKSSIDRINLELEDFKEEIARRFKRSKFNQTYVFPRLTDSECRSNKKEVFPDINSKNLDKSAKESKPNTTSKDSK